MRASRAEPIVTVSSPEGPVTTSWGVLSWTQAWELALPGVVIGLAGGLIAGGLAAAADLSVWVVLVAGGLGLPLAAVGALYEILLAKGRAPLGTLGPIALVWVIAFPPIRVGHAALVVPHPQAQPGGGSLRPGAARLRRRRGGGEGAPKAASAGTAITMTRPPGSRTA